MQSCMRHTYIGIEIPESCVEQGTHVISAYVLTDMVYRLERHSQDEPREGAAAAEY